MRSTQHRSVQLASAHKYFVVIGLLAVLFSFGFLPSAQADQESDIGIIEKVKIVSAKKHAVKVTWAEVANADQYHIRLLDKELTELNVQTSEKNSKKIEDLTEHTKYALQVRAVRSTDETVGEWSTELFFYTKPYSSIAEIPAGIEDDFLPEDVRMYKNAQGANDVGAIKLAMGDVYDDLLSSVQQYSTQQSMTPQSAQRKTAAVKANWLNALGHRARELADQNTDYTGGESADDPHVQTFDGLKYDNQARGVFWLVQDSTDTFSIQSLQRYVESRKYVSYNSGVAIQAGEHTITFNNKSTNPVTFDGSPLKIVKNRIVVWPGGMLLRHKNQFLLMTEEDQTVLLQLDNWLDPEVVIKRQATDRFTGLLGNENSIPYDDLSSGATVGRIDEIGTETTSSPLDRFMADGARAFEMPLETFYEQYIEPWAVNTEDSLFATNEYIEYLPPANVVGLDDFSEDDIQTTSHECVAAAGLTEVASSLFNCVYDRLVAEGTVDELASFMKRTDGKVEPTVWIDTKQAR